MWFGVAKLLKRSLGTPEYVLSTNVQYPSPISLGVTWVCCLFANLNWQAEAREALLVLPGMLRSSPALRVAMEFVKEWRKLPPRKRPLLRNRPCRPPLKEILTRITPKLSGSTRRYSTGENGSTARVSFTTRTTNTNANAKAKEHCLGQVQCLFCGQAASEQGRPVHRRDLYCSVRCMEAHALRRNGGSLRRLVRERDGGICSKEGCGIDCLALVSRLKAVQSTQRRREILIRSDARFGEAMYQNLRERLVLEPKEGNAWHADHVTAVYQGGGECGADNLQTLCVVCHAEVTKKQAQQRAIARNKARDVSRREEGGEEDTSQRRLVCTDGDLALSGSRGGRGGSEPLGGEAADLRSEHGGGHKKVDDKIDDRMDDDVVLTTSRGRNNQHRDFDTSGTLRDTPVGEAHQEDVERLGAGSACTPSGSSSFPGAQGQDDAEFERLVNEKVLSQTGANGSKCSGQESTAIQKRWRDGVGVGIGDKRHGESDDDRICFTRVRKIKRRLRRSDRPSLRESSDSFSVLLGESHSESD